MKRNKRQRWKHRHSRSGIIPRGWSLGSRFGFWSVSGSRDISWSLI